MAMIAGPTTAIMPTPTPSRMRVASNIQNSVQNAPMAHPTAQQASEMTPIFLAPNRCKSQDAGRAVIMPMIVNTEVSQPASVSPIPKSAMTTSMTGGTLF